MHPFIRETAMQAQLRHHHLTVLIIIIIVTASSSLYSTSKHHTAAVFVSAHVAITDTIDLGAADNSKQQQHPKQRRVLSHNVDIGDRRRTTSHVDNTMSKLTFSWILPEKGEEEDRLYCTITLLRGEDEPSVGWLGFGIAENESGGMLGSDVALVEYLRSTTPRVRDTWISHRAAPLDDPPNSQDWRMTTLVQNATHLAVSFTRQLAAGLDPEWDRPVLDNGLATNFVFAYGPTDAVSYHSPQRRYWWTVNLFQTFDGQDLFEQRIREDGIHKAVMTTTADYNDNLPEYSRSVCYQTSQMFPTDPTGKGRIPLVVALEVQWSLARAHHWSLYGVEGSKDCVLGTPTALPRTAFRRDPLQVALPPGIGYDMSRNAQYQFSTHVSKEFAGNTGNLTLYWKYATPGGKDRITASDSLIWGPGAPLDLPVGDATYTLTYDAECTRKHLTAPVTLFDEIFHMHHFGVTEVVSFYRPSPSELSAPQRYASRKVEYADYASLRHHDLAENIVVHPGDIINISCRYSTTKPTRAGMTDAAEMCMYFSSFYPAEAVPPPTHGMRDCMRTSVVPGYGPEMERREETRARKLKEALQRPERN